MEFQNIGCPGAARFSSAGTQFLVAYGSQNFFLVLYDDIQGPLILLDLILVLLDFFLVLYDESQLILLDLFLILLDFFLVLQDETLVLENRLLIGEDFCFG
jgi:hypothetical protein